MPRNAEVTRQWKLLQAIESSRAGKTIDELAEVGDVCTRTIRRDLEALQEAGFTLYDSRESDDGKVRWKLDGHPFRSLRERTFTVAELAALYFSRKLLECAVEHPFSDDLKAAFDRFDEALSPRMREFLGQLPQVLTAKPGARRRARTDADDTIVTRLINATLDHRKAQITYHSFSSGKIKDYDIEPHRLAYSEGALYLFAFVPQYREIRTFAVDRIRKLTVLEETFKPVQLPNEDPFRNSLGTFVGKPEHVVIEFAARVAPYIKEREWHHSQKIEAGEDGVILLHLDVCLDWHLTRWLLGFGPFARVVSPPKLAEQIFEELEEARDVYAPKLSFT